MRTKARPRARLGIARMEDENAYRNSETEDMTSGEEEIDSDEDDWGDEGYSCWLCLSRLS